MLPERETRKFVDSSGYTYCSDLFPDLSISMIPTPGHTDGSVTYRVTITGGDRNHMFYATGDAVRLRKNWLIGGITDKNGSANQRAIEHKIKPDVAAALERRDHVSIWTGHTSATSDPARIRSALSIRSLRQVQ
jgi:glyoxylase-like metal-dependent hydrolase (beta-lactamase superfamily II)